MAAAVAPVWVATDDVEIAAVVRNAGGEAVLTRADHPSGSDRTFEAVSLIDPDGRYNLVLNLQGDLPEMDETIPSILLRTATASGADLTTLVTPASHEEAARKQVVKAVVSWDEAGDLGAGTVRDTAALAAGTIRKTGAAARPGSRHAHRGRRRRRGACRGRHAGRPRGHACQDVRCGGRVNSRD